MSSQIKIRGDVININSNDDFILAIQKSDNVYGPFSNEDYVKKRFELKVPENLELGFIE